MNPEHPIEWFEAWYADAVRTEPRVPDAMQLATVDASGMPRIRTVLMKGLDERGLVLCELRISKIRATHRDTEGLRLFPLENLPGRSLCPALCHASLLKNRMRFCTSWSRQPDWCMSKRAISTHRQSRNLTGAVADVTARFEVKRCRDHRMGRISD